MKSTKEPKVKLTLSVKKSAIEDARKFAALQGTSLSSLFEEYLLSYSRSQNKAEFEKYSLADELFGCAKDGPLRNMTDKEIKDMMVKDRYGL
ncbi:DUF6364 family protein [Dyadobacter sp. CY326]|uniref:DUF6364 family protein n=1 Tax=Dyadobacter sp. CY326 TaxID=2907300 RepID=UPI001F2BB0C1|nr:DUF6364 family protein [Dyadobacter sp. CY326]MCE7064646.1 DUF6364 family protein [Dyadobacter sp. CY326]